MSLLQIYRADRSGALEDSTQDGKRIADLLGTIGVRFERWPAGQALAEGATPDAILAAYATEVARLRRECGYQSVDVVRVSRGLPDTAAMRAKFLDEHRHTEDEVRLFVEGCGSFYLHVEDRVFHVVCAQHDLIGVPANTRHWFDMGTAPQFCAIRLFTNPDGWVAQFTGESIASRFPSHDDALAYQS
jgi:1,2-dihydroxy-3-keto-5-methylthiopentene dioxygenase